MIIHTYRTLSAWGWFRDPIDCMPLSFVRERDRSHHQFN